jgi:cell division transport system permease protein
MRFLRFSFRQAFQGLWRNRVMNLAATVTMILMLVLLATLTIVISGMEAGLTFIESKVEVRAELLAGVPPDRVSALQRDLEGRPDVASTTYVSQEQARAEFDAAREAAGQESLSEVYIGNPFPAQIAVQLVDPRESEAVATFLRGETAVVGFVNDGQNAVSRLVGVTGILRTIGVVVLSFVGLTVLLIVINAIRMALMSRAQEIEIMRLVGASDRYVRWPFIIEGLLIGIIGSVVTLSLLLLASAPISDLARTLAGQVPVGFSESLTTQLSVLVIAAGLGLGGLGAWISVRAYLRS